MKLVLEVYSCPKKERREEELEGKEGRSEGTNAIDQKHAQQDHTSLQMLDP